MHQVLKNIRALREIKGFSQEYMAECLGITQSSYARFENEGRKIDYKVIEKIAKIYEVPTISIIDFHNRQNYVLNSDPSALHESAEAYLKSNKDILLLQEKVKYLEKMNDMLQKQLTDKEEIISLLKTAQGK